jgi:hypothetical protein
MDLSQLRRSFSVVGQVENKADRPKKDQPLERSYGVNIVGAGWSQYVGLTAELFSQLPPDGAFVQITGDIKGERDRTYMKALAVKPLSAEGRRAA